MDFVGHNQGEHPDANHTRWGAVRNGIGNGIVMLWFGDNACRAQHWYRGEGANTQWRLKEEVASLQSTILREGYLSLGQPLCGFGSHHLSEDCIGHSNVNAGEDSDHHKQFNWILGVCRPSCAYAGRPHCFWWIIWAILEIEMELAIKIEIAGLGWSGNKWEGRDCIWTDW